MIKIIILLTSIFLARPLLAQSLQESCPIGTSFDGYSCINNLGYNECPDGYTLQYPNRTCIANNLNCNGTIGIDEFGQTVCKLNSNAESTNRNLPNNKQLGNNIPSKHTDESICPAAFTQAKSKCDGSQTSLTGGINTVAIQFNQAKSTGNIAQACTLAKQLAATSAMTNSTFASLCQMAIRDCKTQCSNDIDMNQRCDALTAYSQLATLQATNSASAYAASDACAKTASNNKCNGDQAYGNPECSQYCLVPSHQTAIQCQQQLAANQKNTTTTNSAVTDNTKSFHEDSDVLRNINFKNNYANEEKEITPSQTQALKGTQNNTGFTTTTNGTNSIGSAQDTKSENTKELNPNKTTPTATNNAGFYVMNESDRRELEKFHATNTQPFSLQSLLPKDWNKSARGPSSLESKFADITAANGLSNFQKITLKLKEKRPELLP